MSRSNEPTRRPTAEGEVVAGWSTLPRNPDPAADLEYECVELDFHRAQGGRRKYVVVLPADAEEFGPEAYLVADTDSVRSLDRMA